MIKKIYIEKTESSGKYKPETGTTSKVNQLNNNQEAKEAFAQCPTCNHIWSTQIDKSSYQKALDDVRAGIEALGRLDEETGRLDVLEVLNKLKQ